MTELKKGHNFAIQGLTKKKKICVRLFFVLMLHIKFQVPSSSRSLVFTTNNNAILVESKKGHNPVNILQNSLKS